ncbi:ABC-three component system protein [Ensifer sp. B1-9]|uniref:ABC-three component system protein n=1 Tax=Ensifer sp. B1-9 TaxID=3141455 RepID=UPI003D1DB8D5
MSLSITLPLKAPAFVGRSVISSFSRLHALQTHLPSDTPNPLELYSTFVCNPDPMLPRDYRLHELNEDEFEKLVVRICVRWLGEGVTPFARGRDGGRDGKFHGTANAFPSAASPLSGHFVLQAKHISAPNKSCSDPDFAGLLGKEHGKIKRLNGDGICDHYLVFTNRKYTGGADEKFMKDLLGLGIDSAHIIGVERLHLALDDCANIRETLPNWLDPSPFRFNPDELVEVIGALHAYTKDDAASEFDSALDFEKLKMPLKNKLNGVSDEYYKQVIVAQSMPHFDRVAQFLQNPRNEEFAALYHDAADELKQKIIARRAQFGAFDDIFVFMYEQIQEKREALRGKRRLISILLHYMYFNCDIGIKQLEENEDVVHADA